ncbi:MAG: hypothetical protein JJ881_16390, partial [Alphaproteobacteria bacterium]|nr:hypothetical protein [Alphaproteobacteria bacterium]
AKSTARVASMTDRPVREPRPHAPSAEEDAAHKAFLAKISNPIWTAAE